MGQVVQQPLKHRARVRADFIDGMGKIGGKFVIILDIQKVLSVEEIASLATVADRGAESGAGDLIAMAQESALATRRTLAGSPCPGCESASQSPRLGYV